MGGARVYRDMHEAKATAMRACDQVAKWSGLMVCGKDLAA